MAATNYSSWLISRVSAKHEPPFFFFYKPPTTISNIITRCTTTSSTDDSSLSPFSSYSRRWYNPLKRKPYNETPSPDISRHWVEADQPNASHEENFTVVSYNILGDKNAWKHKDLYTNVDPFYLTWGHRKRVLCEELIGWSADIICLQEVDRYFDLFSVMERARYAGSYKRRTGGIADGCAMFWKADRFRLLEGESIEFKALGLGDNVAQLSVFEICKDESRKLLIGNIHVRYNPHRGEIKLGQIRHLLSRAQILAEKWGGVPVIFTGDFNSTPKGGIYKFLASSELDIMLYDRKELSGQRKCRPNQVFSDEKETRTLISSMDGFLNTGWTDEEIRTATGSSDCQIVTHPFKLKSSYATVKGSTRTRGLNGEPLATSYHSKFLGTVDYLWYSNGVVPIRVLDTLSLDILRRTGGLPYEKLGSDHLGLVCEFAFTEGAKEGDSSSCSTASSSATSAAIDNNKLT